MKVRARLEFEIVYYDSAAQCFNRYTTKTAHQITDVNYDKTCKQFTVLKKKSRLNNVINKMCLQIIYI